MACPKKPFPRISPWMRSQGRKIRCDQLEGERRDSERPISRVRTRGSLGDAETGDLQVLLLRLQHTSTNLQLLKQLHYNLSLQKIPINKLSWLDDIRYLRDLLFNVPLSTESLRSISASPGEDSRMREAAGTPSWLREEPRRSRSRRCLTGSYSIKSCRVWVVRWMRSSTCDDQSEFRKPQRKLFVINVRNKKTL